jgi:hypothetical protein
VQVVIEQPVADTTGRDTRQFHNRLRADIVSNTETELLDAEIDVKVQAAKNEHQAFALDVGALKAIYQHVGDKGLLGVSEGKYGKRLADLYDECQVTKNVARQQKVKVGAPWVAYRFGTDSYVGQAAKRSQGQGQLFQVDGTQRSRRHGEQAEDLGREVG